MMAHTEFKSAQRSRKKSTLHEQKDLGNLKRITQRNKRTVLVPDL
jgi:hypothetical protein